MSAFGRMPPFDLVRNNDQNRPKAVILIGLSEFPFQDCRADIESEEFFAHGRNHGVCQPQ